MVLDERFLSDGTVVLVNWEYYRERKDLASEDDRDEAFWEKRGWLDVRVPVVRAAEIVIGMEKLTVVCFLFPSTIGLFFSRIDPGGRSGLGDPLG